MYCVMRVSTPSLYNVYQRYDYCDMMLFSLLLSGDTAKCQEAENQRRVMAI